MRRPRAGGTRPPVRGPLSVPRPGFPPVLLGLGTRANVRHAVIEQACGARKLGFVTRHRCSTHESDRRQRRAA
jgi:hypothetical protein